VLALGGDTFPLVPSLCRLQVEREVRLLYADNERELAKNEGGHVMKRRLKEEGMKYGTIKQEAAACRKRFRGVKVGSVVWFCHHEKPLEILTEPASARIDYILSNKPMGEQAVRLHWFRPFKGKLTSGILKAYADWKKADADWKKAYADWKKAYADALPSLMAKHMQGCPWDGKKLV
jgi:hypothetical protein